jgi:hypothetical protein
MAQVPGTLLLFVIPDHQFSVVVNQRLGRRFLINFDLSASSDYLAPIFDSATFASRANYRWFSQSRSGEPATRCLLKNRVLCDSSLFGQPVQPGIF